MIASEVFALSLDELERHDPHPTGSGPEQRFLCPLPACRDHTHPSRHRSLSANVETGLWHCHRCGEGGLLREYRGDRPRPVRRPTLRVVPKPPPAPKKPDIIATEKVGTVRRWPCQD